MIYFSCLRKESPKLSGKRGNVAGQTGIQGVNVNVAFSLVNVAFSHVNVSFRHVNESFRHVNVSFRHVNESFSNSMSVYCDSYRCGKVFLPVFQILKPFFGSIEAEILVG